MDASVSRSKSMFRTGSVSRALRSRSTRPLMYQTELLERRDVPAVLGDFANVQVPANTGIPVTIIGGSTPQTYSVTSSNPNIVPSIITGNFLTLNISHNSSGAGDPQIDNQTMTFQLFGDVTPDTVAKIEELVTSGFYSGKNFHRIANGFPDATSYILQGGSVNGDGTGDVNLPGFPFPDEFVQSLIFNTKYQLAMANAGPDTNSSQFFITTGQPQFLNYKHTIFGQVVEGTALVDEMTTIALNGTTPINDIIINSATLSTSNNNGVLLLNANTANVGQSAVINVTATDPNDSSMVTKSFTVDMITSPVVNRPFLAPVVLQPSYKTDVTASFVLQPGNPQAGSVYTYVVASGIQTNPTTGQQEFIPVTNATVNINQSTGVVQVTPQTGFVGPLNLLVGIRDQVDRTGTGNLDNPGNYDRENITMNFSPDAPTPPVAVPQVVDRGTQQEIVDIQLEGQPGDPNVPTTLTYAITTNPTNGTLLNFDPATGKVAYKPNTAYIGSDSFAFTVTDQNGLKSTAATVTINPVGGDTRAVRVIGNVLIVTPPHNGRASNTVEIVPVGDQIRVIVNGVIDNQQPLSSNIIRIVLFGSKASDTLTIDPSITVPATINGGMGGVNRLTAGGASSLLHGWYGKRNILQGGAMKDRLIGRAGKVRLLGSEGGDTAFLSSSSSPQAGPRGTFYRWVRNRFIVVPAPKPLPFRSRI